MSSKYHDIFEEGLYYHVFNRTINKELLYRSDQNYNFFLNQWNKYFDSFLSVMAYCLMPNHFHFFVRVNPLEIDDINKYLEEKFKRFLSSYTLAFNKQYRRNGSLFQKRFKRIHVDKNDYFTKIIHYIHNNPVHHGITNSVENWKYNSYRAIISNQATKVCKNDVLKWFGGEKEFVKFHKNYANHMEIENLICHE